MAQPTPGDWHVDAALSNLSLAVLQSPANFVAPQVFQNIPVAKQSDKYHILTRADFARSQAKKRAPGVAVAEGGFGKSTGTYSCDEVGISIPVTDQAIANADPASPPDVAAANWVTHQMLLEQEIAWASDFFTTSVWGTDITGVAASVGSGETYQWSDKTNSDPIDDVDEGRDYVRSQTGIEPNTMVMGASVYTQLKHHPDILGRINGGATTVNPAMVTQQMLAEVFDVERLIVGKAIQNTAAEGDTAVYADIIGKKALLTYVPPNPGIYTPAAGYRFSWTGYLPGMNEFGHVIDRMREPKIDSEWIRGRAHYDQVVMATELGYFFDSIVA